MKIPYLEDFEVMMDVIAQKLKEIFKKNETNLQKEYALVKNTGCELVLRVNSKTYEMVLELKNAKGDVISSQEFDFPIEMAFVNVGYNKDTHEITFTLQNGETTKPIDISDIVRGLVPDDRTIAGLNLKSDITAAQLKTALGINDKLDKTGDASNATAAFTQASARANITSGEKMSVILGKISKIYADLKSVAFSGSYSDLSGTPGSLPASDVPSWAKADKKPSYTPSEVGVIGTAPVSGQVAVFDGTTGKIKSSGYTIAKSVPSDAVFTDTTYTNTSLGQGYGTCATVAATTGKAVTLSGYDLTAGGIVSVKFTYAVPAGATMNINSKGAKPIYYKGKAIVANTILAGDVATFIYDGSYYHLISTDNGIGTGLTAADVGDGDIGEITEADIDAIVAGTFK